MRNEGPKRASADGNSSATPKKAAKKVVKKTVKKTVKKATKKPTSGAATPGAATAGGAKAAATKSSDSKGNRAKQWWTALALALALVLAVPLGIFSVNYIRADLPAPDEIQTAQISTIFASDSSTELARLVPAEGNRQQVKLDQVPEHVQNAVLAAEDRDFWDNSGFSFTGFGRALLGQITGNASAGGGSTITQQYVKNTIVGNEHSYTRKFNELVYSIKMTHNWSKEEILQGYLNTIYFGRNAYGIQAAAQAYFNKPASELTVEEGAVLAGLIQLPSQLDPWNNPQESENRWNYVLDGMVAEGWLSPEERAGAQFPETRDPATYSAYTEATGANGLIKNHVIEELSHIGITEDDVTNRGLQITTTIDPVVQQSILDTAEQQMAPLQEDARTGVVAIDPSTGGVRGYYGGDDPSGWDYANAGLQTGSTFKIFGLAAALQQGIPLSAMYDSSPVTVGDTRITNDSNSGGGMTTMAEAMKNSYNTSFIRIQSDLDNTTYDTADTAHALGVARSLPDVPQTLREPDGSKPYDGIVLGQYQSRVMDMATGMATLINRGVWHPTHFVQRVTSADGEVLYEFDPDYKERRISGQVADNVIQAMLPIAGWSHSALAGGRPSAAKTGTSQFGNTGGTKDAWMVGGTPELAVAVWVGTADNTSRIYNAWGGNMYGSMTPGSIWKGVLDSSLANTDFKQFPTATPINWGVNPYTGGTYPTTPIYTNPSGPPEGDSPDGADGPGPAPEPAPEPLPDQVPVPDLDLGDLLDELVG